MVGYQEQRTYSGECPPERKDDPFDPLWRLVADDQQAERLHRESEIPEGDAAAAEPVSADSERESVEGGEAHQAKLGEEVEMNLIPASLEVAQSRVMDAELGSKRHVRNSR